MIQDFPTALNYQVTVTAEKWENIRIWTPKSAVSHYLKSDESPRLRRRLRCRVGSFRIDRNPKPIGGHLGQWENLVSKNPPNPDES